MGVEGGEQFYTRETLKQIEKLLAHIIETSSDLSPSIRQNLRGNLYQLMASIGITDNNFSQLADVYRRFNDRLFNLPSPSGYPAKDIFIAGIAHTYLDLGREQFPRLPEQIQATDVARHAQSNWYQILGRGGMKTIDYLFEMGKLISSEFAYTSFFDHSDAIEIGEGWQVSNGRHRSFALRALGENYVAGKNLNQWVEVKRVSTNSV